MDTMTVVTFGGYVANALPRPAAPIQSSVQGTGAPAAGIGARLRSLRTTSTEHDFVPRTPLV
jgi:hypothetical protein